MMKLSLIFNQKVGYPNEVVEIIRQTLDLEADDKSADVEILEMPRLEAFNRYCNFKGIPTNTFLYLFEEFFGIQVKVN